jgi:hypothetical protein
MGWLVGTWPASSHVYLLNTIMHIFGFLGVTQTRQWHVPTGHKVCVGTTLRGVRVLQAKNNVSKSLSGCLWDVACLVRETGIHILQAYNFIETVYSTHSNPGDMS